MKIKRLTIKEIERVYARYNRDYFQDSLPNKVRFKVSKIADAHGECSMFTDPEGSLLYYQIEFSKDTWLCGRRLIFIILLHEMSHLAAGLHNNHRKPFPETIQRLMMAGAYDNLR